MAEDAHRPQRPVLGAEPMALVAEREAAAEPPVQGVVHDLTPLVPRRRSDELVLTWIVSLFSPFNKLPATTDKYCFNNVNCCRNTWSQPII